MDSDFEKFKRKLKSWVIETRYPFLSVTIIPVLLGGVIALARDFAFNALYFALTLIGSVSLHLGTNIINDYFDHKSGNDEDNNEFIRPFSGGSRTIQLGLLTPLEVLTGSIVFFSLGILIGLYLVFMCGLPVLFLGLFGVLSGFFYTAPRFNWVSKGIGELLVGLNFGILNAMGTYFVQTGKFSGEVFWASLPLGIFVSLILFANEFPDFNADKSSGKKTLVVRLGRPVSAKYFSFAIAVNYALLLTGVIAGYIPILASLGLASLPFAIRALTYINKFNSAPSEMAPGNGLIILCFNIVGVVLIMVYLSAFLRGLYIAPLVLLSIGYIFLSYRTVEKQRKVFQELKSVT